jgi:putative tRNA adenosine deaminase-associated protein
VSTFAAAVARGKNGWTASELDLSGVADIDEVVDRLRDAEPDADVSLLFVEADDQYLVILRLDEGEDLACSARIRRSRGVRIGAMLLGEVEAPALEIDDLAAPPADDDEEETRRTGVRPRRRPGGRRRPAHRPRHHRHTGC